MGMMEMGNRFWVLHWRSLRRRVIQSHLSLSLFPSQHVPIAQAANDVSVAKNSPSRFHLVFSAVVPPLGYTTFWIDKASSTTTTSHPRACISQHAPLFLSIHHISPKKRIGTDGLVSLVLLHALRCKSRMLHKIIQWSLLGGPDVSMESATTEMLGASTIVYLTSGRIELWDNRTFDTTANANTGVRYQLLDNLAVQQQHQPPIIVLLSLSLCDSTIFCYSDRHVGK